MGSRVETTIVVPAYNEEQGLPVVLEGLRRVLTDAYEVLVVDDGSEDRTAEIARQNGCRVVSHARNRGKGAAVRTGLAQARGAKIILIDADGSYPAEVIPQLAQALDAYDLVVGARRQGREHIPPLNRLGSALFRSALNRFYGFRGSDPLTGLYGVRRTVLERMCLDATGFGVESEIAIKAARMGLRMLDIPIEYRQRYGTVKLHPLRDGSRIFGTILRFLLVYNPTVTFIIPGLVFLISGVGLMALLLFGPLQVGRVAFSIHTTMISGMLGLVGSQAVFFGLAAKLYALAHRFTVSDALTDFVMRPGVRWTTAAMGASCAVVGTGLGIRLVADWAAGGFGDFTRTQEAEVVSFLVIFGVQLLLSVGFLAIFAEDLRRRGE